MAEYIEREAVVRAFCEHCRGYVDKCTYDGTCEVDIIATVPTADVQTVVHCKDCKYAQNPNDTMVYCTYFECGTMSQNDFCSQGERSCLKNG